MDNRPGGLQDSLFSKILDALTDKINAKLKDRLNGINEGRFG